MSTWTNAQFMKWLTEARVSSLSQEHLKIEAEKTSTKKLLQRLLRTLKKNTKKCMQMSLTVYLKSWVAWRAK